MTTETTIPAITLHDGRTIPQLGFGTLSVPPDREPTPDNIAKTAEVVGWALEAGIRHVDTAQMYGNERGVGQAIAKSGIPREELWITSKLGNANHHPADVERSYEETLDKLGLEHLDLFLMHWPLPTLYDGDYVSTWKAMTDLVDDGKLGSAGVSNFHAEHLERIITDTGVIPVVNQIEAHPYFANTSAIEATRSHGIAVEAWSPLGQGTVLEEPAITEIAAAKGKTVAQVILRWHIQHDHIVFPKSMHRERIQENLAIFDFALSPDEMTAIDALDRGEEGRVGPNPETFAWVPSAETPNPR